MLTHSTRRKAVAIAAGIAATALVLTGCSGSNGSSDGKTELTFLFDNADATVTNMEGLIADFTAENPDITFKTETRPGGGDGDNIVKTKLATGEMQDIFFYNTGSLFQALAPEKNIVDLTGEAWQADVLDSFKTVVTANGKIYGAPAGTAMGGAILYNKKVYADLGLEVPKTWDEFTANNEKILAAGVVPVIQTYKDTWTSQLFVLGDFANIETAEPGWAADYTANKAKYATDPIARAGFEHLADYFTRGFYNADFGSATFDQGQKMLAEGAGAHYPMLTFAVSSIIANFPEQGNDIGVFAIPGDDADANPLTVWQPAGLYIPTTTTGDKLAAAKKFLAFVASSAGCDSQTKSSGITGPYLVQGCDLPADVPTYVSDMLPYFERDGGTVPALEFLSPIKGPSLEQITVAVGSGITDPQEGAKQYDADVEKQAQQLGLEGW